MIRYFFITFLTIQVTIAGLLPISDKTYLSIYNAFGKKAIERVLYISKEIENIEKQSNAGYVKLWQVNRLINKVQYKKSLQHWGV